MTRINLLLDRAHEHADCRRCSHCHACLWASGFLTPGTDCGYGEPILLGDFVKKIGRTIGP